MSSRQLLRALGMSRDVENGVARLEKSLFELKEDIDAALQAFRAKNERRPDGPRQVPPAEGRPLLGQASSVGQSPAPRAAPEELGSGASSFDPTSTYVCLSPSGSASTIEVTPEFWTTIDQRTDLADGRLVAAFACDEDWPHWEMHPHGEEILVLLSGRMTMLLEHRDGERSVELQEARACVVPRGTWHRALVAVPSRLLAITYGRGTEHRER